jgi:hypothetical protein
MGSGKIRLHRIIGDKYVILVYNNVYLRIKAKPRRGKCTSLLLKETLTVS